MSELSNGSPFVPSISQNNEFLEDVKFIHPPSQNLICPICQDLYTKPIITLYNIEFLFPSYFTRLSFGLTMYKAHVITHFAQIAC